MRDVDFAARAVELGLLDADALESVLEELRGRRRRGEDLSLADLLVDRGILEAPDAEAVARDLAASGHGTTARSRRPGAFARPDVWLSDEPRPLGETSYGRYLDPEEVARGGMGVVLRAVDPVLNRPVGLKVLRVGSSSHADFKAALFWKEAQVTGQLQHPNIVPVHELAEGPDGSPYLAMKFVEGESLDARIARGDRAGARSGSELARRLTEFLKIADAIAFAHSRGVIHRDLKPSNVMVGEFGEVLVLDWGLAKVRGHADERGDAVRIDRSRRPDDPGEAERTPLATADGTVFGTPAYMPPEQAEGDVDRIDERSDVYSLGAILYEIVSGSPPFPGTNCWAVLNQVADGRLVPPSARAPAGAVPPELEAVVRRAMARRREDRYPDVPSLAADVEAFLAGRTLAAFRYRPWQRAAKFAARHRAASIATAAVLAIGVGLVLYQLAAERWDRLERAREGVEEADAILAASAAVEALAGGPDEDASRREEALESRLRAASALDRALAATPEDAAIRERRRRVGLELGRIATLAGDYTFARQVYQDLARFGETQAGVAGRLAEVDAARQARSRERERRLNAILDDLRAGLSRPERSPADPTLEDLIYEASGHREERTVEVLGRVLDDVSARAARASGRLHLSEDESILVRFLCRTLGRLGPFVPSAAGPLARLLEVARDPELAVEAGRALCLTRQPGALPGLLAARDRLGMNSSAWRGIVPWLARLRRPEWEGEPTNAAEWVERGLLEKEFGDRETALAHYARAIELDPGLLGAWVDRGIVRFELGDVAGAVADLTRAIELDPASKDDQIHLAYTWRGLARWKAGERAAALADLDRGVELSDGLESALHARANVRRETGDLEGALADYDRAIESSRDDPDLYNNRGLARRRGGDLGGAIADYGRALEVDPRFAAALVNRGQARLDAGDTAGAIEDFGRALELEPRRVEALAGRANARAARRDPAGALADFARALELEPDHAKVLHDRAMFHLRSGDPRRAIADYDRFLARVPHDAEARNNRGTCRQELGDLAGAAEDFAAAAELAPDRPRIVANLAHVRLLSGQLDEAIRLYGRAIELDPAEASHRVQRGAAWFRKGDLDRALGDYEAAVELDPRNVEARTDRGAARFARGDVDGALADHAAALELAPDDWLVRTKYGLLLAQLGRKKEALESLRRARDLAPPAQRPGIDQVIRQLGD